MTTVALVLAALVAGVLAWVLAGLFRQWAIRHAFFDVPNGRSSHTVPTPRGGGVGIVLGVVLGLGVWVSMGGVFSPRAAGWLAGSILIAAVSFADDLRPLPARLRLGVHVVAAGILTAAGVQGQAIPLVVAVPLAFLWVTTVTNVYNFMDGIDSLAAGQAIVAGVAYFLAGAIVDNDLLRVSGAVIAAAAGGFLLHNLPPARVFMGDVSSTFLGFSLAGLALLGNLGVGGHPLPFEFGLMVLAPFLFDGVVTLARRVLRGERWFEAHRSHYYQRLVQAGRTHGQVSMLYTGAAIVASLVALIRLLLDQPLREALAVAAYLPMLGIVVLVWQLERRLRSTVGAQ